MAKIALLRPAMVHPKASYTAPPTPPLGLAYLAGALEAAGHTVQVVDAIGSALHQYGEAYTERLAYRGLSNTQTAGSIDSDVDGIAVTTMFSQDWPHTVDLLEKLATRFAGVPIIVGGEHATAMHDYIVETCLSVRMVGRGEGEEIVVDFARWLDGELEIADIGGVTWRSGAGTVVVNPARARIVAVEKIARPAWHLFDLDPYFESGESYGVTRGRTMPILATRGCPYRCSFCSSPQMWTTRYVMRDAGDVVDEIEGYLRDYGATNIDFYDLTAVVKKSWILAFCAEVGRRGLRFSWQLPSGTRSEAIDAEVVEAMVAAGCNNITYAPESGSVRTLEKIHKKVSLDRLTASVRAAVSAGVSVKVNLILGFPHERRRDVLTTIRYAARLARIGIEDAGLYVFSPYPGSELYTELRAEGRLPEPGVAYFESLTAYTDITEAASFCRHIGARELNVYRVTGLATFYALSYLCHPTKLWRSWRNLRDGTPHSLFEDRLHALWRRRQARRRDSNPGKGEIGNLGVAGDAQNERELATFPH